jgi:hypothetical protein
MTPAPGSNFNLGHGFDGTGHNVAWASPQPFDQNGNLLLATYLLFNYGPNWGPSVPAGTILEVGGRLPPSQFPCFWSAYPLIVDAQYNLICQAAGEMRVNGGPACTVAVEARTWTEVRNLYR